MWYFLCVSVSFCAGFVFAGIFIAGKHADRVTDVHAANQRATALERANGVLRRELAELRLAHEAPRNHGYGATDGR